MSTSITRNPSRVSPRPKGRLGFTLIETVLVMVVIGVMLAMVAPQIDQDRWRMDAAILEVGTRFMAAQSLSVVRGHDVMFRFDESNGRILVHSDLDNDGQFDHTEPAYVMVLEDRVIFGLGGAEPRSTGSQPISITKLVGGKPVLTFHRSGSTSEEAVFYLTSPMSTAGKHTRAIEIERATGRIRCLSYKMGTWRQGC